MKRLITLAFILSTLACGAAPGVAPSVEEQGLGELAPDVQVDDVELITWDQVANTWRYHISVSVTNHGGDGGFSIPTTFRYCDGGCVIRHDGLFGSVRLGAGDSLSVESDFEGEAIAGDMPWNQARVRIKSFPIINAQGDRGEEIATDDVTVEVVEDEVEL